MHDNISTALITAFEQHYDTRWDDAQLRNERLAWRAAWDAAGATPAAVAPEHPPMPETWAVVASIEGQDVVCISSNAMSGKGELTESEEQAVIGMAQHLLAFVGYGLPPCDFDPDDEPAPAPALEAPAAPSRNDVNDLAQLLFDAWAKAEPEHGVTKHPMSYWASFCDMARAVLAAAPQTPAEAQEPAANLHDDGYWTPTKTEAGRALNERLMRAGSPRIPVYTHPTPQQAAPQAPAAPLCEDCGNTGTVYDGKRVSFCQTGCAASVAERRAVAAAPAAPAVDATSDTARMDWLEKQVVNVRAPLRYGSRDLFWASPEEMDGGPDGPSDLRARIDAAQAAAKGEHDQ